MEIGALHLPAKVPPAAKIKYVDILSKEELEIRYPELSDEIVEVDILDDGEYLRRIDTQDFVIANHFLEHCQDLIGAVENMLRVLKPGGVLMASVPDKRFIFDSERPVTTFEHLLRDNEDGPEWSRRQHFEEWVTLVDKIRGQDATEAKVEELMLTNYSIHYHVWRQVDLNECLVKMQKEIGFHSISSSCIRAKSSKVKSFLC